MIDQKLAKPFEVRQYGIKLFIDKNFYSVLDGPGIFIDVETDEKDNFVGLAACQDVEEVFYYTKLDYAKRLLENCKLSGHNVKGDLHWLKKWGINVSEQQIENDSMIMSYVMNPTAESHSLKNLGKSMLGLEWPTYKEMTHPFGGKKVTLDAQSVETVANYCGMDAIVSYRLSQYIRGLMTQEQLKIYQELEMPINRLLFKMEETGLTLDKAYLKELKEDFSNKIDILEDELKEYGLSNPRSSREILKVCEKLEMYPRAFNTRTHRISSSAGKPALLKYKDHTFVKTLFEHKKLSKLHNGYLKRYEAETETTDKVYPQISQISIAKDNDNQEGIKTGRLASDFHNIPRRSETGALLRRLFVANDGYSIICGDYSQIEYRLLAHFSSEPVLLEAFKTGKDVHAETAALLGVKDRDLGKTFNFAAIYGAMAKRIVEICKQNKPPITITEKEADAILKTYWAKLPNVTKWITLIREKAKKDGYITTLHGWRINIPGIHSTNKWERLRAERQCVNYVIQGSAAYIIKKAMINLRSNHYFSSLQVHDELLFVSKNPKEDVPYIQEAMELAVKLDVPLIVDIGYGKNWAEAKESHK